MRMVGDQQPKLAYDSIGVYGHRERNHSISGTRYLVQHEPLRQHLRRSADLHGESNPNLQLRAVGGGPEFPGGGRDGICHHHNGCAVSMDRR